MQESQPEGDMPKAIQTDVNGDGVVNQLDWDILIQMAQENPEAFKQAFNENPASVLDAIRMSGEAYIGSQKQSFKEELMQEFSAALQAEYELEQQRAQLEQQKAELDQAMQAIKGKLKETHPELFDGVDDEQQMMALLDPIAQELNESEPEDVSLESIYMKAGDTLKGKMAAVAGSKKQKEKNTKPAGVTLVEGATPEKGNPSLKDMLFGNR